MTFGFVDDIAVRTICEETLKNNRNCRTFFYQNGYEIKPKKMLNNTNR